MRPWGRAALVAGLGALVLSAAGCGAADHPNNPRIPAPVTLTADISDDAVTVSPDGVGEGAIDPLGAGLVEITIANLSGADRRLLLDGPVKGSSKLIAAGGTGFLKIDLVEGKYQASAEGSKAEPALIVVGPERASAHNEILLP